MSELMVLDHVHWDREWYRPHEEFRARLVELVVRVVQDLEAGRRPSFHLDGQTIAVADALEIRSDLEPRLRALVRAGRLTVGPWHVLADNQLVSGESLVRNLLIARRWGERVGGLAGDGYSPDAFGHPADLPRVLRGFGIDTALVWRGAPPEHARFRWRSPDGSEVLAVNQRYHEAEVLWDEEHAGEALTAFVGTERRRRPDGPWLLMNGGDHLVPRRLGDRREVLDAAAATGVPMRNVTLPEFFDAVRADGPGTLPVVDGELRRLGDRLTFLLPGTLSARTYLKQANARAQHLLVDGADPLVVRSGYTDGVPLVEHAWDLAVQNAPHDSVCGCSVDEVHRENLVRAERVHELVKHVRLRALDRLGLETRRVQAPPTEQTTVAVLNPQARPLSQGVVVDLVTGGALPVLVRDAAGQEVPFEVEDLGVGPAFEADLDVMPDTASVRRVRLAFVAHDVPAHGERLFTVELGGADPTSPQGPTFVPGREVAVDGWTVAVADDASLEVRDEAGAVTRRGLARLVDGGDRGDSYTWDPPLRDELVSPTVTACEVWDGPVRRRLRVHAELDLPAGLADDRDGRGEERHALPLTVEVTAWMGRPGLTWVLRFDNTVTDHRLRLHAAAGGDGVHTWLGDGAWSLVERPLGPVVGPLPEETCLEAEIGTSPVLGLASVGVGSGRTAVFCPGLPEAQGLEPADGRPAEVAVTLLRGIGWLSRFDLRTRTAGAGPQLETPEAQCLGPQRFELGLAWGDEIADDLELAARAAEVRAPLWPVQVFGTGPAAGGTIPGVRVEGALAVAWKPADDGRGSVLRVSNPTSSRRTATVTVGDLAVERTELDERPGEPLEVVDGLVRLELPPFALVSLRLTPPSGTSDRG